MKLGKATRTVLNRSVFKNIKIRQKNVIRRPQVGLDANGVTLKEGGNVISATATIIGRGSYVPFTAVHRALNNIYASQAKPQGITVSLTVPRFFEESTLKVWMKEIDRICEQHEIDILGGQTTISEGVVEPVLTINALGIQSDELLEVKKIVPDNQTILLTKVIGMEGTIQLAEIKLEDLKTRYTERFILNVNADKMDLSLKQEYDALIGVAELYLHDVAEGGIFGALWELSEYLRCGIDIDLTRIPMKQETIEFCEFYDINPYKLMSGGALLIVTSQPDEIIRRLQLTNVPVVAIGNITSSNDKVIRNEDELKYLEPFHGDDIYKVAK